MSDGLTRRGAVSAVAAEIRHLLDDSPRRVVVGVTGPPGTGKSTFARNLLDVATATGALLPMDGFHLSNRQLVRLGRRDRKGAPDTFDVEGYVTALARVAADTPYSAPEVRRARLIERHVGGGRTRADAERWVDLVDEPNAAVIAATEAACDRTLRIA